MLANSEHSGAGIVRVARSIVFLWCVVDRCLLFLVIELSVFRFTASDYLFGILKLFLVRPKHSQLCGTVETNKQLACRTGRIVLHDQCYLQIIQRIRTGIVSEINSSMPYKIYFRWRTE